MEIKVGKETVYLDTRHLEIDETTLNDFLKKFAGNFNDYSRHFAQSQYLSYLAEDKYENLLNDKMQYYKENGAGSDKTAEAKARIDPSVVAAKKAWRESKYTTQLLFMFIRAMDRAHEDALNLGYNIRKEMDKIFPQAIKGLADSESADEEVAKIFEAGDE